MLFQYRFLSVLAPFWKAKMAPKTIKNKRYVKTSDFGSGGLELIFPFKGRSLVWALTAWPKPPWAQVQRPEQDQKLGQSPKTRAVQKLRLSPKS